MTISLVTFLAMGTLAVGFITVSSLAPTSSTVSAATLRVSTEEIPLGGYIIVQWLGDPIIFTKHSDNDISAFIGVSTFRGCRLEYSPPGHLVEEWKGGWFDPCHVGAWDMRGNFVIGANSGEERVLASLSEPKYLTWDGEMGILHK